MLGVVDKEVWKPQRGGLRKALRTCQTDMCSCVADYINRLMDAPHEGLTSRLARALSPDAVSSQISSHITPWDQTRSSLQNAKDFWDEHCGGPPPHPQIGEYLERDFPTQAEWEALHGRPMPEYSDAYPPPLSQRIWNALPSAQQVCVGTFTGSGALIGGAGGFVVGGGGGAAGGTLVAPGVGTVGGAAVGAYQGAAIGGAGGAAVGYGLGDWLCR